jgi:hypothetical protein
MWRGRVGRDIATYTYHRTILRKFMVRSAIERDNDLADPDNDLAQDFGS